MKTDNLIKDGKRYNEFVGDYGLFWNNGFEEYKIVDRLTNLKIKGYKEIVFAPIISDKFFDNFKPLTEEQLKVLDIKN